MRSVAVAGAMSGGFNIDRDRASQDFLSADCVAGTLEGPVLKDPKGTLEGRAIPVWNVFMAASHKLHIPRTLFQPTLISVCPNNPAPAPPRSLHRQP